VRFAGVRAVERTERVVELHPRFELVDHAAELGRAEFLLRRVDAHVVVVRLEQVETGAAHREVEFAADREDRVAQRFGFRGAAAG